MNFRKAGKRQFWFVCLFVCLFCRGGRGALLSVIIAEGDSVPAAKVEYEYACIQLAIFILFSFFFFTKILPIRTTICDTILSLYCQV